MRLTKESYLSKKLKRRIMELCGFEHLSREERLTRAHEIYNSTELKQAICHKILGTTFKDIEKVMEAVVKERQLTPEQTEQQELYTIAPEKFEPKFDPDLEFKINRKAADPKKDDGYGEPFTREECARLLALADTPVEPEVLHSKHQYGTYSREEVQVLMQVHYDYLEREKKNRERQMK